MLSARPPYGMTAFSSVSSMDELQLAQHVRSNISGSVGDTAAHFIRMFKISGRVFVEMQGDHLELVSQGDPNVMGVYLKLQGKVVTGRLRERRHSIVEIYPELGPEFPSIYGHSRMHQPPTQSLNRPTPSDGLNGPHSAPDQGPRGPGPFLRPAGHLLAFDVEPVFNPIQQLRHHHAESKSEYINDESVGLGMLFEDAGVEGGVVGTSDLDSFQFPPLSPLAQREEIISLGRCIHSLSKLFTDERHNVGDFFLDSPVTSASAPAAQPSTQPGLYLFACENPTPPPELLLKGGPVEAAPVFSGVVATSLKLATQGNIYPVEATPHGSNTSLQNTESAAQPIEELYGHTVNEAPREQDAPVITASIQTALTVGNEPSDQGANDVHVDERSFILSYPTLEETHFVTETVHLELSGPNGARTIDICDPVSNATCKLCPSDLRTEDPCPLDLSAVIVADVNEKKMSQNTSYTPRASSADPAGKYIPASLPLDQGSISIGSSKHSNSTSLTPSAISSVTPIASTSPVYFQDQPALLLSDPPHDQIFSNKDGIFKADTGAIYGTRTPLDTNDPTTHSPHVGSSPLHATAGDFNARSQVLATLSASSRVAAIDLDFKTAAQGCHGMVSDSPSFLKVDGDNVNPDNGTRHKPNLKPCLDPPEPRTVPSLEIELTMDNQPSDHILRAFATGYVAPGHLTDGLSMGGVLTDIPDEPASIGDAFSLSNIDENDFNIIMLDDSEYNTIHESHIVVTVQSASLSISSSVSENSRHEDEAHRLDGPLFHLLPIVPRLPSLEYWYSPTDTSESCQLWKNIFGQAHTSCREARTEPTTKINSHHMFSATTSLSRQDTFYETTVHIRGDVPFSAGKSHESDPTSNNPVDSTHSTLLLPLELPKSSLIEDMSAIFPFSISPSNIRGTYPPSATVCSRDDLRHPEAHNQRNILPIIDDPHGFRLCALYNEYICAKLPSAMSSTAPIPEMSEAPLSIARPPCREVGAQTLQDIVLYYAKRAKAFCLGES